MTIVYVIFILLAIVCSFAFDRQDGWNKYKLLAYRGLYAFLICIVGFSYGLGGDKFAYMGYFENYYDSLDQIWECIVGEIKGIGFMPLWTLLCLVVKSTTDSFYILQFSVAILVNIPICEIVRRHTSHGFIFLLLYFVSELFFQFNTEVMREGPAIAMGLVAIECYMAGNKKCFWLFTLLGIGFHISAIILCIFPWVKDYTLSRRNIILLFGVTIIGWAVSEWVLQGMVNYFLGHSADAIGRRMLQYSAIQTTFFGFLRSFLSMMVVPVSALYFNRQLDVEDREKEYRKKMSGLLVFLAFVGCCLAGFTRFFNYVQVFYLIMLSELIFHIFDTKVHFIFRVGTIVAAFIFWIWYELAYWPKNDFHFYQFFVPYTCILDESEDVYFREDAYHEVCNYSFYEDRMLGSE